MVQINNSVKSGSTVVRLWQYLRKESPEWAESSYSLQIARQVGAMEATPERETKTATNPTADNNPVHDDNRSRAPSGEPVETTDPESSTPTERSVTDLSDSGTDTDETSESGVYTSALSYRLVSGVHRFVESSWLYRWLTAEPDAEVVVIDLRETLSAGPVLAQIDRRIRDFTAVMPTSGGLRRGYRLRDGFRAHPIRIVSFGALVVILVGFLGIVATGGPVGIATFGLMIGLLVAARGTQNRTPLSEITDTGWYQTLADTFEPPAPPEGPPSDQPTDSPPSTTAVDERSDDLRAESNE